MGCGVLGSSTYHPTFVAVCPRRCINHRLPCATRLGGVTSGFLPPSKGPALIPCTISRISRYCALVAGNLPSDLILPYQERSRRKRGETRRSFAYCIRAP